MLQRGVPAHALEGRVSYVRGVLLEARDQEMAARCRGLPLAARGQVGPAMYFQEMVTRFRGLLLAARAQAVSVAGRRHHHHVNVLVTRRVAPHTVVVEECLWMSAALLLRVRAKPTTRAAHLVVVVRIPWPAAAGGEVRHVALQWALQPTPVRTQAVVDLPQNVPKALAL